MLVDYLEDAAAELKKKMQAYQKLNRQYKQLYSKDIREEMSLLKEEINSRRREVDERLYEDLQELSLVRHYFPDLYNILLEDKVVGRLVRKKDWLLGRKEQKKGKLEEMLNDLKAKRAQLREAKKFLKKWPRPTIDSKSLTATWPVLKGAIKGELDKEDVISAVKKKDRELKRSGWLILVNESMVEVPLKRFLERLRTLKIKEVEETLKVEASKGKGSVKEYDALKELKAVQKERRKTERRCRHLLLASREYLQNLKKQGSLGGKDAGLKELVATINIRKINEKEWLDKMRKRLET